MDDLKALKNELKEINIENEKNADIIMLFGVKRKERNYN